MPGNKGFARSERLRELFLKEISQALGGVKDPGLSGFLTITDIDLSPDGKTAKVFYSLLGSVKDRDSTQRALERSMSFIRQKLYAKLRLKFVPKFSFEFDKTPESAQRIESILDKIREDDGVPAPPKASTKDSDLLNDLGSRAKPRRRGKRRRG